MDKVSLSVMPTQLVKDMMLQIEDKTGLTQDRKSIHKINKHINKHTENNKYINNKLRNQMNK